MHQNWIAPLIGMVGLLTVGLAGCGGGSSTAQVANVPPSARGGDGSGTDTSAPSTAGHSRPRLRVDDSEERRATLYNAYSRCLLDHGAHKPRADEAAPALGARGNDPGVLVGQPVPAKAKAACLHLLPLTPPELDASTNPDFHAESLAYVDCLRRHGEWVRLLNDHDIDWTYIAGHPVPEDNGKIEDGCLVEAFGG